MKIRYILEYEMNCSDNSTKEEIESTINHEMGKNKALKQVWCNKKFLSKETLIESLLH